MRPRAAVAGALAAVAIAAVAVAWLQDVPHIAAPDAVTAAEDAFEDAGIDATVESDPQRTSYASRSHEPVEVWAVRATVRGELVELRLALAGAAAVAIDDRALDGSRYVLSDLEYEAVASSVNDPARARTVHRNIALTVGAVLAVALALAHAALASSAKEPA